MLEVYNLVVRYEKNRDAVNVSEFVLQDKEKIIILGPNGSGKTTLIKAVLGLVNYEGDIKINGKDLRKIKCELSVSTNLEEVYSLLYLDIKDLISLYMDLKGCDEENALKLVRYFGIENTLNKKLWQLSTGQRKLVTNILAISSEGEILLLDECFDGIDPPRKAKLANLLNQYEHSILITTHELGMLKYLGQWGIYFMFEGKIFGKIMPATKVLNAGIVVGDVNNAILKVETANKKVSIVPQAGKPLKDFADLNILYEELIMT